MKRKIKKLGYELKYAVTSTGGKMPILCNNNGDVLCYEGKVYNPTPLAFVKIIESGDINAPCFSFEPLKLKLY